jgi:hypothetical protein
MQFMICTARLVPVNYDNRTSTSSSFNRQNTKAQGLSLIKSAAMNGPSLRDPSRLICTGCRQYRLQPEFVKGDIMLRTCAICRNKHAKGPGEGSRAKRPRNGDGHRDAEGSPDDPNYATSSKQPRLTVVDDLHTVRRNVDPSGSGQTQPVLTALQDGTSSDILANSTLEPASIESAKTRYSSSFTPSSGQSSIESLIDETFVGGAVEGEAFSISTRPALIGVAPLFQSERSERVDPVPSSVESHWAPAKNRSSVFSILSLRSMSSRPSFSNMFRLSRDGSLGVAKSVASKASIHSSLRSSTQTIYSRLSSLMAAPMGTSHDEEFLQSRGERDSGRIAMSVLGPTYNNKRSLRKEMFNCARNGDVNNLKLVLDTGYVDANDIQGYGRSYSLPSNPLLQIADPSDLAKMTPLNVAVLHDRTNVVRVLLASHTLSDKTLRAAAMNARPRILQSLQSVGKPGVVDELSLLLTAGAVASNLTGGDRGLLLLTALGETLHGLGPRVKATSMLQKIARSCVCRSVCASTKFFGFKSGLLKDSAEESVRRLIVELGNTHCRSALNNAMILMIMLAQQDRTYPYLQTLVASLREGPEPPFLRPNSCSCASLRGEPGCVGVDRMAP